MSRSVLTIGHFDGVHLGHRALLARARQLAEPKGAAVVAITFDRHPAAVLRPDAEPPRLLSTPRKVERLTHAGADRVIVLEPSPNLLSQSAQAFIEQLVEAHRPLAMVEGEDFRFGRGREGDVDLLRDLGRRLGFELVVHPKEQIALTNLCLAPVSSSVIRWLVGHGYTIDAARCLVQPFALTARVVHGERQGRTLGVPTANLDPADYAEFILPPDGVYAGMAELPGREGEPTRRFPAAISLGEKPTFHGRPLTLEAHLLGFDPRAHGGELYGRTITLTFDRWLRDQYAFPSVDTLKSQLARDIAAVETMASTGRMSA